jgi:hypothetical protein
MYYIMNVRMNLMLNTFGNNIPAECWLCPFLPNPALPAQTV